MDQTCFFHLQNMSLLRIQSRNIVKSAATCVSPAVYYRSCAVCAAQSDMTFIYGTVDYDNHVGDLHLEYQEDPSCSNQDILGMSFVTVAGSNNCWLGNRNYCIHLVLRLRKMKLLQVVILLGGYDEVVYCLVCGEK